MDTSMCSAYDDLTVDLRVGESGALFVAIADKDNKMQITISAIQARIIGEMLNMVALSINAQLLAKCTFWGSAVVNVEREDITKEISANIIKLEELKADKEANNNEEYLEKKSA